MRSAQKGAFLTLTHTNYAAHRLVFVSRVHLYCQVSTAIFVWIFNWFLTIVIIIRNCVANRLSFVNIEQTMNAGKTMYK